MEHIIKKQTIELDIDHGLDAFQVQHNMSRHYWSDILSRLEKIFDEYSQPDSILEIRKMEIDLGSYSEQQLEKGTRELEPLLHEQLQKYFHAPSKEIAQKKRRSLSVCQQWLYYMKTGRLPWNTISMNDQWIEQVLVALATDIASVEQLRTIIISEPQVVERIYYQHDQSTLLQLVEILTARQHSELPTALEELYVLNKFIQKTQKAKPVSKAKQNQMFWEYILVDAAHNSGGKATTLDLVAPLMVQIIEKHRDFKALPAKLKRGLKVTSKWYAEVVSSTKKIKTEIPLPSQDTFARVEDSVLPASTPEENAQLEEDIFVSLAGLILVHPFLSSLFKNLKLVKDGAFINKRAQHKALLLLHFMATGHTEAVEHALVISKLLCGLPLGEPVPKKLVLGKKYLEEANFLLKLIISRWEVLKETSPDGLREEFLQRAGKLCFRQGNPYLQVESRTSDVLLDQLPWNIGLIKLPWMKKLLHVEWR